jgi:hypothetical protein
MIEQVVIRRSLRENGEILDVAEFLASKFGSTTNAVAVMVRESPTYQAALRELQQQSASSS